MDDDRKWALAWAKLAALRDHLPSLVGEREVAEFHEVLALLHEATREDTSPFRMPEEAVRPIITSIRPAGRRTPARMTYSNKPYCEQSLMVRKISAVYAFFEGIAPPAAKPRVGFQ
jgi:hypothetical protein